MASSTVRVRGLREMQRDFRKMGGSLPKETRAALREAGKVVAVEATSRFGRIDAHSAAGFRPVVRARGTVVEQRYRRTTGQHPEFGALQMQTALIPALDAKQDEVIKRLDRMLDDLSGSNGFN